MFGMIVFRAMLAASQQEEAFLPRYRYGHGYPADYRPARLPVHLERKTAVILPFKRPDSYKRKRR